MPRRCKVGSTLHKGPGGAWTALPKAANQDLLDVWALSENEIFALSNGGVFRYDGASWTTISGGLNPNGLRAIGGSGADNIWVAGHQGAARWDGSDWTWERETRGRALHVFPDGDVLFLSDDTAEFREDGTWREMRTGLGLTGVRVMTGAGDEDFAIFDGFGPSLRYQNGVWVVLQQDPLHVADAWTDLRNGDIYLTGWFGPSGPTGDSVIRLRGDAFSEVYTAPGRSLTALWGVDGEIFAGGEEGTLLHFDGADWSVRELVVPFRNKFIHALAGVSRDEVYAVATDRVYRYDGSSWTAIGTWDEDWFLDGIAVRGHDDVFVLGTRDMGSTSFSNEILHYDGSAWTPFFSRGDNESWREITVAPGGDLIVAGVSIFQDPPGLVYRLSGSHTERELGGADSGGWDGVWISPGGRVRTYSRGVWSRRTDVPW